MTLNTLFQLFRSAAEKLCIGLCLKIKIFPYFYFGFV